MKRNILRIFCAVICAVMLMMTLAACSKSPYEYELADYITVPDSFEAVTVTYDEVLARVDAEIDKLLENKATLKKLDRTSFSELDDILNISFKCYLDAEHREELTVMSDDNCTLVLQAENGDSSMIAARYPVELRDALLGKQIDHEFSVEVNLPETFTADVFAGLTDKSKDGSNVTKIYYVCKINEISVKVYPEYNDEFVQSISEFQTVEQYEQYLYERMREELIFDKLLAASEVQHYPVNEVQAYTASFNKYYTEKADALKITLEQYIARKFMINMTDFHLKADAYAKSLVKEEMVLYTLARRYGLELTDDEYRAGAQRYVVEYGLTSVSKLEAKFGTDYVRQTVLLDKVLEHLSSLVTVEGEVQEQTPVA